MVEIPLRARDGSIRATALVDDEDVALAERRWFLHSAGYAAANVTRGGRKSMLLLHRAVLGMKPGDGGVDHIDGDRLNCRRVNLRKASQAQNMQNVASYRGSTSRYRGVSWHTRAGKWTATVMLNRKNHYLGLFVDEAAAARAARAFRAKHMPFSEERGEHAIEGAAG